MISEAQYYLHKNGKLIYKPHGGVDEKSPFVKAVWAARDIAVNPMTFLAFLKEAKEKGAERAELQRLHDFQNLSAFIPKAAHELGVETVEARQEAMRPGNGPGIKVRSQS